MSEEGSKSGTTDIGSLGGIVNETPNTVITTVRLDGTNFPAWSQLAKLQITEGKSGYLYGAMKMADLKDATYAKWEAENAMVVSWLLYSMQPNIANNYLFPATAKAI